jgi:glucose/arabinose dehydrogenase
MIFNESAVMGPKIVNSSFKVDKVVGGLDNPIGISFIDKNDFLIIEKDSGKVKRFTDGVLLNHTLVDLNVANENDRGLTGIAISKNNFENKTYVFLYLTESYMVDGEDECDEAFFCDPQHNALGNRIYRYELFAGSLTNPKLLLDIPPSLYAVHTGSKIVIGEDKNLYISIGDMNVARLLTSNTINGTTPYGTGGVIRITQNGSEVTPGIFGDKYPYNLYYAYGIRLSFGLAFDPLTGNLWETENGPDFGDEINLVEPGSNGGWNKVTGNREHTSIMGGNITLDPINLTTLNGIGEYSRPELATDRFIIAPTSVIFMNSTKYGNDYQNDMFVSTYRQNGTLYHFDLTNNRTELLLDKATGIKNNTAFNFYELEPYIFGEDFGGIADLELSPDGYLYVVSFDQDAIYRIVPG